MMANPLLPQLTGETNRRPFVKSAAVEGNLNLRRTPMSGDAAIKEFQVALQAREQ